MTRTYELGFIVDPRQSDEAVQEITGKYREMIEASGAEVTKVDFWGRRKLAYPIQKFNEGKYVFLYISSTNGAPPFPDVERLMNQNDKILRYLTVRTDLDLKRAARKGKPGTPGGPPKAVKAEAEGGKD
ncbi:MAG: 30S ribosomal protein S6 [Acidobacteria bacterium]|nr:MAG: 30S ribosomal protein S6 [Acidobacteriota bacterium]